MMNNNGSGQKLQIIFFPAISVLNRMGYTRKFTLLWLMSSVAIAVVTYSLFVSLDKVIQPSQRELQGLALIEPVSRTVQFIQLHRGLSAALLGGNEAMRERRVTKEREAAEAFKAMDEKLPPRLTPSKDLRLIKADWERLRKEGLLWTADENFAAHTRLIEQLQSFEVSIADDYALILDVELDTSYLIDTNVNKLPHVLEHLGQLRAYGTGILARKQINERQKIKLNNLIAGLDSTLKELLINIEKTGRYNPAVRESLLAAYDGIANSARQITGLVASDILVGHFATPPDVFLDMATAEINNGYTQMHESLLPTTKTLIEARIARAENTLLVTVSIAVLLFLLVVYISVSIYYAIIGNIRSLVRSAHTFAEGDLNQRVKLSTRDELSQIGDSFNKMADGFSALLEARTQAVHALYESEKLYRSLFENMLNGFAYCQMIFEQDQPQDFIYLSVNAAFETQTGLKNAAGKKVSEVIPGIRQTDPELFEVYGRVSLSGKPERLEIYLKSMQQWFWVSVYSPEKGYFVAVFDVVTERKRADEALRKSMDLLQSVVENAPFRIFWKDRDSRYLGCNTNFAKAAGHSSPDELIGKTDFDMWRKDLAELYRADDKAVMDSGNAKLDFEEPFTTPDGNPAWARTSKVPLRDGGNQVIGILGLYEDITGRKQAEDSLRKLSLAVEQSPNSIVITGLDANIEYVNEAFVRTSGYSRADLIGQNPRILHSGRNPKAVYDDLWAHLTLGEVWHGELINRRKDGSEYIEEEIISPVRQADGRVTHYLGIKEDITNRKRMEAELLQLNDELEEKVVSRTTDLEQARLEANQANRAKSEFLSAMSHEIRTPMNGVIGMLDVLQQSSLSGSQTETVNIIHDSAFALLTIIDDILDFSKIEAGKLQVDYAPMGVAGVVEGVCETLIPLASKKGVELTLFTDPGIPSQVIGDAGRLRQILVNLANNAIKFSSGQQRQGKVSVRALLVENSSYLITVRPELVEGLGGSTSSPRTAGENLEQVTLEFRVTDNGIGIDETTQARLFTPFTQADTSTTRNFGGTGLGLVIARQLANIMGGEITLHSEPGKGSMFSVYLPFKLLPDVGRDLSISTAEGNVSTPSLALPLQGGGNILAGLTCLVADGSGSMADDLATYLVHAGALVERAAGLAAVKQWIASRPPGLCVAVIDTEGVNTPLDELRAAARTRPDLDARFVAIGRGGRRQCRIVAAGYVELDAEVMHRRAFLEAVAIAAGRAEQPVPEAKRADAKVKPLLSREEARRQGSLILVAEDNEINQKVILQQLALLGQTADIANNGREALERWRSGDYALLFADLHMPEMDGYELTEAIRAAEKGTNKTRIPIIAFTANALKGEADHCVAIGMDDYLSKPVQLVNLKAMLEKWLPVMGSPPIDEAVVGATSRSRWDTENRGLETAPTMVDVNVLKALIGDDEATIRDFLHDFRLSAAKIAVELRAACAAGQAAAAGALAHKLKSSARSVGALALGELCAEMEKAGKGSDAAALAMLLPQFEQELASVEGFLDGY